MKNRRRGRRGKKRTNRFVNWFKKLSKKKKIALITVAVILVLALLLVGYIASKFSKIKTEKIDKTDIEINQEVKNNVGVGYTNFVLFGGDSREGEVERNLNTDSIIIASLNNETKEIKMVSVYRDTLLDVKNGSIRKCNSAYALGGPTQAINMLNTNLDLNIEKYVTVDFSVVVDVIDLLGGIEVDVSAKEMSAVNDYLGETAKVAGKPANYLTKSGLQTLDGAQATTYARIRKGVGDDFARAERQRLVIQLAAKKAMKAGLGTINKIIDEVFPRISTNFTMTEILGYAADFANYSFGENAGFPFDKGTGTISGRGSSVFPITLSSNVIQLHEFLFGSTDYTVSSRVNKISASIKSLVGDRQADSNTTWTDNSSSENDDKESTTPSEPTPDTGAETE